MSFTCVKCLVCEVLGRKSCKPVDIAIRIIMCNITLEINGVFLHTAIHYIFIDLYLYTYFCEFVRASL